MFSRVNKVIKAYIYWDFLINSAWGLLAPIFAIFLIQTVSFGNIEQAAQIAGFGTFFYWVTKSILQIPIGNYLDRTRGEKDDFWFYVIGSIVTGLVPFGFLFSYLPWHIYALNVLHAIGMSMVVPSSAAIFIRHADKGKEAYETGLDSTLLGIGAGITGALGGILVGYIGFKAIFILTGAITLVSVFFILMIKDDMTSKTPRNIHELPIKDVLKLNK